MERSRPDTRVAPSPAPGADAAHNRARATVSVEDDPLDDIPDEAEIQRRADSARRDLKRWKETRDALGRGMHHVSATQAPTVIDQGALAVTSQIRLLSSAVDRLAAREEASAERLVQALEKQRLPSTYEAEQLAMHKERLAWWRSRTVHIETTTALVISAALVVFAMTSLIFGAACFALWFRLGGPAMLREAAGIDTPRVTQGAPAP